MIAVDSSAIVAVVLGEAEASTYELALLADEPVVAVPALLESFMVLTGRMGSDPSADIDLVLTGFEVKIVAFDTRMLAHAQRAFLTYGKGRHPARLNFGDCMSYGLAKALDIPLLFKGEDFAMTDIARAV